MTECLTIVIAIMVGAFAPLQIVGVATVRAADDAFEKFPLVILCKYKDTSHAFYLSRVAQDGVATYVASDRIAGTVTLDGQAKAIGGEGGGTCVGKTLQELRASGQAHDLKP
jgi:hypothetical protein